MSRQVKKSRASWRRIPERHVYSTMSFMEAKSQKAIGCISVGFISVRKVKWTLGQSSASSQELCLWWERKNAEANISKCRHLLNPIDYCCYCCFRVTPMACGSSQQCRIRAVPANYTTAHGNAGSFTHWARPGIEPTSSWTLAGFLTCWAMMGTPGYCFSPVLYLTQFIMKRKLFYFIFLFTASPVAYGRSQARGWIRATAAGLHHRPNKIRSEPYLQPMLQLVAILDP